MKHYKAPWSTAIIVISFLATAIFIAGSLGLAWSGSHWLALLPLAFIFGSALFTIRGYTTSPDAVLVHRLLWSTRLPLTGLQSAQFVPDAMRGSLRTFGNGGWFCCTGFFWNRRLGSFRAFVTDQRQTVVLRYPKRTVVMSPITPEEFVRDLEGVGHSAQ